MSSDEPFALSTMAESAPPAEAEYEAICTAFMETQRGRWFLAEYARRNRNTDTKLVLDAISRIEDAVQAGSAAQSTDRFRSALTDMAQAIARTKADIAALRPESEHHGKISEASEELDLIVDATARATSEILAAAEHIQEAAWTMREQGIDSRFCDELDAKATEIYTACSFQDITGQRTHKVVQVLRYLEGRIHALIDIWGSFSAAPGAAAAAQKDEAARHDAMADHAPTASAGEAEPASGSIDMAPPADAGAAEAAVAPVADPEPVAAEELPPEAVAEAVTHPEEPDTLTSAEPASLHDDEGEAEPLVSMLEATPPAPVTQSTSDEAPPALTVGPGDEVGIARPAGDVHAEAEAAPVMLDAAAAIDAPAADTVASLEGARDELGQEPEMPPAPGTDGSTPEAVAFEAADAIGAAQTGETELQPEPAETVKAASDVEDVAQSAVPASAAAAEGESPESVIPTPPAAVADVTFMAKSEGTGSIAVAAANATDPISASGMGAPPSSGPEVPAAAHGEAASTDAASARPDTPDDNLAGLPKGTVAAAPGVIPSTLAWLLGGDMVGSDAVADTAAQAPAAEAAQAPAAEAAQASPATPEPDVPPAIGLPADIFAAEPSERLAMLLAEGIPEAPEEPAPSPAPHLAGLPDIDFGVAPLRPPAAEPRRSAAFLAPAALAPAVAAGASSLQFRWTQSSGPAGAAAASASAAARPSRATELDPAEFLFEAPKPAPVGLAGAQGGVPLQAVNGATRHGGGKPGAAEPDPAAPQGRGHATDRAQRDPLGAIMALTQEEKIALFG